MTNAQRREILARIPRSEAGDGAIALVLPDFFANPHGFGVGQIDAGKAWLRKD
jgi:hypothetical protein